MIELLSYLCFLSILWSIWQEQVNFDTLELKIITYKDLALGQILLGLAYALPIQWTWLFHRAFIFLVRSRRVYVTPNGNRFILSIPNKPMLIVNK